MSRAGRAQDVRRQLRQTLDQLEEQATEIEADRELTDEAKREKISELEERKRGVYRKARLQGEEVLQAAEEDARSRSPETQRRRAVADDPDRFVSMRTLAETLPPEDLLQMAREARETGDLAGLAGLLQGGRDRVFPGDIATEVQKGLEAIASESSPGHEEAVASLIAVRSEVAGVVVDAMTFGVETPETALNAAHAVHAPLDDGDEDVEGQKGRKVYEDEVESAYQTIGLDRRALAEL